MNGNIEEKTNQNKKKNKKGFSNFFAKILCVLAAIMVWFYVSGTESPNQEKVFHGVRIDYINSNSLYDQGFSIMRGNENTTVDVTVTGTRMDLSKIDSEDITATVDLSGLYTAGDHQMKIKVTTPGDTKVKNIFPSEVQLKVDKSLTKTVSVKVKAINSSINSRNLKMEEPVPSQKEVRIRGAAIQVQSIEYAEAVVDLEKYSPLTRPVNIEKVPIKFYDKNGDEFIDHYSDVKPDFNEVDVLVPVTMEKEVGIEITFSGKTAEESGYKQTGMEPESVIIRGNPDIVRGVSKIKTSPGIGFSDKQPFYEFTLMLSPDNGVELAENTPESVTVTFEPENGVKHNVDDVEIVAINTADGKTAIFSENSIKVAFSGSHSAVEKLKKANPTIIAVADLKDYKENGTHRNVPLKIRIMDEFEESYSISVDGEYTCTVTLTENR